MRGLQQAQRLSRGRNAEATSRSRCCSRPSLNKAVAAAGAAPAPAPAAAAASCCSRRGRHGRRPAVAVAAIAAPEAPPAAAAPAAVSTPPSLSSSSAGHTALLHGLGDVGDMAPAHMPWALRIVHAAAAAAANAGSEAGTTITGSGSGGGSADSQAALAEVARGLSCWRASLNRGLLPDDEALRQLQHAGEAFASSRSPGGGVEEMRWPQEPLRTALLRGLGKLGVARFAQKYPAVADALVLGLLQAVLTYTKRLGGVEDEEEAPSDVDENGNKFQSVQELMASQAAERAARRGETSGGPEDVDGETAAQQQQGQQQAPTLSPRLASLPPERLLAVELTKQMYFAWRAPMETLDTAGRAFAGLEALLGGAGFSVEGNIWRRQGWGQLDELRRKLEDLKELRDLVRSLGRGGGWGPLRRAPVQHLDLSGRPGLLRTVLEAQETRGLTRSDDISRLLPAEAAMLARGRTARWSKLLFFARMAEKGLQTYERDGWGEFPTQINPARREIRPTADRGPILMCVDTSGSMRGARETVAKALALECMRAAKEQERDCYVFAFAGPTDVRELELGMDMPSVLRLLDFLEALFNGGSDFNEPLRRCLDRLTDAKWANSDILLVSDGELRQPGPDIMRKLSGAKEKLGLRVHGLVIGSPEKQRADPAVLRALCTNYLPNGKVELCLSEFEGWASVQADAALNAIDWDDVEGNTKRRLAGLAREKRRQEEAKQRRRESKAADAAGMGDGRRAKQPPPGAGSECGGPPPMSAAANKKPGASKKH